MNINPAYPFIISLINEIYKQKELEQEFIKDLRKLSDEKDEMYEQNEEAQRLLKAEIRALRNENDALRMELARTKKGFKQSKK